MCQILFISIFEELLYCFELQLSHQLNTEKSLLEEELHKINEDIRQKQAEVEGTLMY